MVNMVHQGESCTNPMSQTGAALHCFAELGLTHNALLWEVGGGGGDMKNTRQTGQSLVSQKLLLLGFHSIYHSLD